MEVGQDRSSKSTGRTPWHSLGLFVELVTRIRKVRQGTTDVNGSLHERQHDAEYPVEDWVMASEYLLKSIYTAYLTVRTSSSDIGWTFALVRSKTLRARMPRDYRFFFFSRSGS